MTDRILLRAGHVISMDPSVGELPKGDVLIEDGRIAAVRPEISADAEVLDMTGRIVIPGFVDTHRHTWEAPIRASPRTPPWTTTSSTSSTPSPRCTPPRTCTRATSPALWSA